LKELFELRNLF